MDAAPAERKIEIIAPASAALEWTRQVLFRPFDLTKWLVIGFAAFLAGLADGTRSGSAGGVQWPGDFDSTWRGSSTGTSSLPAIETTLLVVIVAAVVVLMLAIFVVFMWLGSRGRFMFIDCVVRNRAAIAEPWREYQREGNALFIFTLVTTVAWFVVMALLALPFLLPFMMGGTLEWGAGYVLYLLIAVAVVVVASLFWALIFWFVPPVMYRQRCGPIAALRQVVNLIVEYPVPFILFLLTAIVLVVGGWVVSCLVTCFTCCIAAIPYVGTVILLPLYVFYYSFTLLFLRQFGEEFDPWPAVAAPEPPAPAPEPPSREVPPLPPRTI